MKSKEQIVVLYQGKENSHDANVMAMCQRAPFMLPACAVI